MSESSEFRFENSLKGISWEEKGIHSITCHLLIDYGGKFCWTCMKFKHTTKEMKIYQIVFFIFL